MHRDRFYTLSASCPDRVGIIARVSGFIAEHGGWILESSFHADDVTGRYFMRIEIKADSLPFLLAEFRDRFRREIGEPLAMDWRISDSAVKKRVVVMVSKQEHCLYDLLARWQSKELDIEIPCIISNHDTFKGFVEWHGIPFIQVPVNPDNKAAAYAEIQRIFDDVRGDTMVLARYMRVLPPDTCWKFAGGRIINLHHGLLPSFPGFRPYHDAFAARMLTYGATCHFIVPELDAGNQTIYQSTFSVPPGAKIEDIVREGQEVNEPRCLVEGVRRVVDLEVKLHFHRVIANTHSFGTTN